MLRVLLVDDDIAEISAVKRVILRAGHQPVLATSASEALASIAHTSPALLVVGSTCEEGEALRRLAEEALRIPIVVLGETAAAPEGATQVPRPLDPAQLADRLAAGLAASPRSDPRPRPKGPPAPPRGTPPDAVPAPQASRKAAADALRARAEELRRGAAATRATASLPAEAAPRAPRETKKVKPAPDAALTLEDPDDPGLEAEAILRRAEEAERTKTAMDGGGGRRPRVPEARSPADAAPRAPQPEPPTDAEGKIDLDDELERLGQQLDEELAAQARIRGEVDRASSARAAEARRRQGEDARQRSEEAARRESDEEQLRSAITSARAEMEALRRRSEDEARRRAAAEAEIARLGREEEPRPAVATAEPDPLELPVSPPPPEDPSPDPAEESARRRVAALRGRPAGARPQARAKAAPSRELPEPPPPSEPDGPASEAATASTPLRAPPPELRAGTLADLPAPRLLALAAGAGVSGRIDFEGEASRSIYFEDGAVVGATSSDPAERVEEIALRLGLVTREQHRHVSAAAAPLATRRAALVLLERGFLKPTELTGLARRRTEEVVFGVFGDSSARFRWTATTVPPDERTTLERTTLALAVEGMRRRWLAPAVEAVLGGAGTLLAPAADGPTAAELGLSSDEVRAVALADGLRTLDEIVASSPLDPLSTRQALAALVLMGSLAVRTFQGGRPAAAATAAIDLGRVREKLDQVRRADYFTVLGVGRLCTPHEVREAFERLRAEFDPSRFRGVREDGLERRLDEILAVVGDARDVLADERLRGEYLRGLGDG